MSIQENRKARRAVAIQMNDCSSQVRLARLSDRAWDLDAQYNMMLRAAGLERP